MERSDTIDKEAYTMTEVGYYNGTMGPLSEMTVPMNDRAVYFGDGVYEVVVARNKKLFALSEHLDRFYTSIKFMEINFTMNAQELTEELMKVLEHTEPDPNHSEQIIYWQVSRGTAIRNHAYPDPAIKPNLLITARPYMMTDVRMKRGKLITMEDTRFLHCNIKTLNLIPNIMAYQAAVAAGCNEVVFHRDGIVTECAKTNLAILKGGALWTAPLGNLILAGVTRKLLLDRCAECSIPVHEEAFTLEEMMDADEIIVVSTGHMCMGVDTIDGKKVGGKSPELLDKLQNACLEYYLKKTE